MKLSETSILNTASIATLVAFPLLYQGVHSQSTPLLFLGMALVCASMALPLVAAWLRNKR